MPVFMIITRARAIPYTLPSLETKSSTNVSIIMILTDDNSNNSIYNNNYYHTTMDNGDDDDDNGKKTIMMMTIIIKVRNIIITMSMHIMPIIMPWRLCHPRFRHQIIAGTYTCGGSEAPPRKHT